MSVPFVRRFPVAAFAISALAAAPLTARAQVDLGLPPARPLAESECSTLTGDLAAICARAASGDVAALLALARAYAVGPTPGGQVQQNQTEALRLYSLAAARGDAAAINVLGEMYSEGRGVARDEERGARYFRAAAEAGLPDAQVNLAESYANGRGVPQSLSLIHI